MSAKALAADSFEPATEQTVATEQQPPEDLAAERQFREDLWREYRREALNAGFSAPQAAEYASALSPDMGLLAGASAVAPLGRGWYYQSRIRVVQRTIASGVIESARWRKIKATGRIGDSGSQTFALRLRTWSAGKI
jgi:hypothetical protein